MKSKETLIYRFFKSDKVEQFFFSALCATIFTAGLFHSMLDLSYKYLESQAGKSFYVDFNWVFWAGAIISLFYLISDYIIPKRQLKFDFALALLIQTMIMTGILSYHRQDYSAIPYTWILPVAYIVGKLLVGSNMRIANERITIVFFVIMVAIFIAALLDLRSAFQYKNDVLGWFPTEEWPGFWTGEMQNRCGMAVGVLLAETSVCFAVYRAEKFPVFFGVTMLFACVGLYWGQVTTSRTVLLVFVLSICTVIGLILIEKAQKKSVFQLKKIFIVGLVLLLAGMVAYIKRGTIQEYYSNSKYGKDIFQNVRFIMAKNGFELMLQNPFGRMSFPEDELFRPHNTFLRFGESYGLIVFIGLELHRLVTLKDAIVMSIKRSQYRWIKYLLIPAFISLNVNFSMDPNGFAQKYLMMLLLFICGMIRGWVDLINRNEN